MRASQIFLVPAFASLLFLVSYAFTPQASRIGETLRSAVTAALPARLHLPVAGERIDPPQRVPHSDFLAGVLESRGRPLFPPKEMMLIASARAVDTVLANLDAAQGGLIRFDDGSYFAVAPHYLSHDVGVSVCLSTPALPDLALLEPASEAMMISFEPVKLGIAYADPARSQRGGAVAVIALSTRQRASSLGHMLIFVKRVFLSDGATADFEESPSTIQHLMRADLAANRVLRYTAHVQGSVLVSLQRVKSGALLGLNEGGAFAPRDRTTDHGP